MAEPCLVGAVVFWPIVLLVAAARLASKPSPVRPRDPPRADRVLEATAEDLGLTVLRGASPTDLAAMGAIEGREVDLRLLVREGGALLVLRIDGLPPEVVCRRSEAGRGHATGDRVFDAAVTFEAPRAEGRTWLPGTTRRALLDLVRGGGEVRNGRLWLHAGAEVDGPQGLVRRARRALDAARELERGPVPLLDLVTGDLDAGARIFALDELVRAGAADRAWLAGLARRDDEVAVRAATHLGDADRLRAMLGGPACREAVLALVELAESDARLLAVLRRLVTTAPDPELLAAAGRVGPVTLLPVLLGVGPPLDADARRAALAIQAREAGLRGGLAVVGAGSDEGRLSVAAPPGGRLADPDA